VYYYSFTMILHRAIPRACVIHVNALGFVFMLSLRVHQRNYRVTNARVLRAIYAYVRTYIAHYHRTRIIIFALDGHFSPDSIFRDFPAVS